MIMLFSTSIMDLSSGRIPLNQVQSYMIDFLKKFIASVLILIIGLLLIAESEIDMIKYERMRRW
jgi:hypothetical protein